MGKIDSFIESLTGKKRIVFLVLVILICIILGFVISSIFEKC